jgi:hypothetical protein
MKGGRVGGGIKRRRCEEAGYLRRDEHLPEETHVTPPELGPLNPHLGHTTHDTVGGLEDAEEQLMGRRSGKGE